MKNMSPSSLLLAGAGLLTVCTSPAAALPADIERCVTIADAADRLACYDLAVKRESPAAQAAEAADAQARKSLRLPDSIEPISEERQLSRLDQIWELTPDAKQGVFNFRPHRKNFIIGTYNPDPHEEPYRPFDFLTPEADGLANSELAFQLGFKLKALENVAGTPVDLWLGYTQHSYWQISNRKASSPFRETNYQPELMAVLPVKIDLPGMRLRFISGGIVHQSNGQASTLSRSWDRLYLQVGLERENMTLLVRAWKRFGEGDDNPDIIDYMGRGDVLATYYLNRHELSLLARHNFATGNGAAQFAWAFPLTSNLKGFVQYFAGYGYSLIDYNDFQRVFGLGFQVGF